MCVNKIETMYEKPLVNVKVEPRSTFTFTSDLPYVVSNLFKHVKPVKVYVRTHAKITRQCLGGGSRRVKQREE